MVAAHAPATKPVVGRLSAGYPLASLADFQAAIIMAVACFDIARSRPLRLPSAVVNH